MEPSKPLRGAARAADEMALATATFGYIRKLADSGQRPKAPQARLFMSVYGDEVDRVLDEPANPDPVVRAWSDRLVATWQALTEP